MNDPCEIAITGIGVVSALGNGYDNFVNAIASNTICEKSITLMETIWGKKPVIEIIDFDPLLYLPKKGLKNMDRSTKFLCSASKMALENAGIEVNEDNQSRIGVITGTTFGDLKSISDFDIESLTGESPLYVNPLDFPKTTINAPSSNVSILTGIMGYNTSISGGYTASMEAIAHGIACLQSRKLDIVLACGVEGLSSQNVLYQSSLPLADKQNNAALEEDIVLGEGAVVIVMERFEDALKNKHHIYARIKAVKQYFMNIPNSSVHNIPDEKLYKTTIKDTLDTAGVLMHDVQLISIGANGWKEYDEPEATALEGLFMGCKTLIVNIKSLIGETASSGGMFSLLVSIIALEKQKISEQIIVNKTKQNRPDLISNAFVTCADPGGNLIGMFITKE